MVGPALADTGGHALGGWLVAAGIGIAADTLAGLRDEIRAALQLVAIVFLGIPAIARVVVALQGSAAVSRWSSPSPSPPAP